MFHGKPRVVVITDIGNEPDDQMSLVRLLLYSNELDIEALISGECLFRIWAGLNDEQGAELETGRDTKSWEVKVSQERCAGRWLMEA